MDERQNIEFDRLFELSGAKTKTEFILAAIFSKTIKSVKIDKSALDYYIKLTNLQSQCRAIGVNYNQAVKALKSSFSENKALTFLHKLEEETLNLVRLNREILTLTQKFADQWLEK